jgi:hypothetical protein
MVDGLTHIRSVDLSKNTRTVFGDGHFAEGWGFCESWNVEQEVKIRG